MSLKFKKIYIPTTKLYSDNPLFDIKDYKNIQEECNISEASLKSNLVNIGEGRIDSVIPYLQKDRYSSELKFRYINAAILENNYLKATFLLDFGGRLYSLYDKVNNKEILFKNDTLKMRNFSLTNAWFAGGVEWNPSFAGHSPFSCSKVFASIVRMDDLDGLRIYEYERKREICFSIDFFLPKDSKFLIVISSLDNNDLTEKYNSWWSNIAINQTDRTRIITPAHMAYVHEYKNNAYQMDYKQGPIINGVDVSYPSSLPVACNYFYNIPNEEEKWIATVDENGAGFIEASTSLLHGRELSVLGDEEGGNNWQAMLGNNSSKFIEIKAGLTETHLQNIKMLPNERLRWVEIYGALQIDQKDAQSENYDNAINACKRFLNNTFPNGIDKTLSKYLDKKIDTIKIRNYGSGWGYFKECINSQNNSGTLSNYLTFSKKSLTKEQVPFMELLKNGYVKETNPHFCPKGYEMTPFMKATLEKSLNNKVAQNWTTYYLLGATYFGLGEFKKVFEAWKDSYNLNNNAWAARNIAMYYKNIDKNMELSFKWMKIAYELSKTFNIIKDFCITCCDTGHYEDLLIEFDKFNKRVQKSGRILYYKAYALNKLGRNKEASRIINYDFKMHDVREGDSSISELWYKIYGVLLIKDYVGLTEGEIVDRVDKLMPLKNQDFRIHKKEYN